MLLTPPVHSHITDESRPDDVIKWVSSHPLPQCGDRVHVTFNSFGVGEVVGYNHMDGYLGVMVKIDTLPEWYVRQCKKVNYSIDAMKTLLVFGSEFIPV